MAVDPVDEAGVAGVRGALAVEVRAAEANQRAVGDEVLLPPVQKGALDVLPTRRLLEMLLGLATAEEAREALDAVDGNRLEELSRWEPRRLEHEAGLPGHAAEALAAGFALGRRVEEARWVRGDTVRSPGGVYRLMA